MILAPIVASCTIFASNNDVTIAFNKPRSYCVRQADWNNAPTYLYGGRAYALWPTIGTMRPFAIGERWLVGQSRVGLTRVCWAIESFAASPPVKISVYDDWGLMMGTAICAALSRQHDRDSPGTGVGPVYAGTWR